MTTPLRRAIVVGVMLLGLRASAQQRPWPPTPGTSSISGRVIAVDTGKPIRGALVEIVIYGNLSGRFQQVLTDADGKYEFTKIPAGSYQLAASGSRFMRTQFGAQPGPVGLLNPPAVIQLKEAEAFTTANFSLAPFSAIEGTIVDEFGDPAPNVAIQVSQVQYAGGRRRLLPANPSSAAGPIKLTDDKGQFRVGGLPPGQYYVEALSGAFAEPTAAGGFAVTFYPGTTKAADAQPVSVDAGREARNISFALTPAKMSTVSGTLVDAESRPISGGTLMLMPSEKAGMALFMTTQSGSADNGSFTFRNLPPGMYTLQAFGRPVGAGGNLNASAFGYLTFTIDGDTPAVPLTVRVPAPRSLRGRISFEDGASESLTPRDVFVSAGPIDFESAPIGGGPPPTTIRDDWTFEIQAMSGLRLIRAGSAKGWYVKRVTVAGRDVTDTPVDLREQDVNDVELVLTPRTTTVTGLVAGPADKPPAESTVVVFAVDESKWGPWSRYVAFARADPKGAFAIKGLPPGSYVAVPALLLANGEWQDPDYLRNARGSGDAALFTLVDGETKTLALKIRR